MNADLCIKLDVDEFMYLSKGESKDNESKARRYILANAFESIIGAIYVDLGWDASKDFITRTSLAELPRVLEQKLYIDPKSRFQEASQDRFSVTPSYKVLEESGPDHNKKFVVGVYLNKELIAEGEGTSKHEAQVAAAAAAIDKKGW
jgi:ribonuclease-3